LNRSNDIRYIRTHIGLFPSDEIYLHYIFYLLPAATAMAYNINNSNLLNYYPMDKDLSDYASGTATNNATITGVSVSTATTKMTSGAAYFSGVANQIFKLPNLQFTANGITISTWIKTTSAPPAAYSRWFDFAIGAMNNEFCWAFNNGTGMEYFSAGSLSGPNGKIGTTYAVSDTNWHHYCFVVSSSYNAVLYVDGVSVYSWTGYPTTTTMTNCLVGVSQFGDPMFNGYMNQFLVFNRAITATELSYLYQFPSLLTFSAAPTGTLASLTFNVNNSNLLYNFPFDTDTLNYASGTGQTGFANTVALSIGNTHTKLSSGSATFNGNTTVARLTPFSFASTGVSVALWTIGSGLMDGCIYDFAADTSATASTSLTVNQGNLAIRINNASVGTSTVGAGTRTNYVYPTDSAWHHICHTITPAGLNTIYVDGVSIGNTRVSAYPSITATLGNAFIGRSSNGSAAPWSGNNHPGYVNQFLVFNRALTELEVCYIAKNPATVSFTGNASASSTAYFLTPSISNYRSPVPVSLYYMTGDTFAGRTYTLKNSYDMSIMGNAVASTTGGGLSYIFGVSAFYPGTTSLLVYDPSGNTIGAPVPLTIACFLETTLILKWDPVQREETWVAVEKLKKGDFVKTSCSGYKRVQIIGHRKVHNAGAKNTNLDNQMHVFRVSKRENREAGLFVDLYVTGNHCVLRKSLTEELRDKIRADMGDVYITEKSYRVPAYLDSCAEKWEYSGEVNVWHFALENENRLWNYGVYANGLLVESSSIRYMEELAGMELI